MNFNSTLAYLKKISRVPLLKECEEKVFFEELQTQKAILSRLVRQLQNSDLLDSKQCSQLQDIFRFKRKSVKNGLIELSPECLGKLQGLITDWKASLAYHVGKSGPGSANLSDEKDRFEIILTALQEVVTNLLDLQRRLVESNLLLVASIAKQYACYQYSLSFLDLMQEGSIGLMRAIHKFRLEKGYKFSTYATWWISQAIRRALEEQGQLIRVPRYVMEKRRRIAHVILNLTNSLGREPELSELSEAINIKKSMLHDILQTESEFVSLDTPISEPNSKTKIADLIADKKTISPEEKMLSQAQRDIMEKLLSTLSPQQAEVIKLRYGLYDGDEHTLSQIGKRLGLTRERIRRIEAEALSKLRHPNRWRYWQEILD